MRFLKEFITNPTKTGAIAPSSKVLAQLITDTANLADKKCLAVLGPGNGVFTENILQEINPDCTLLSIEINAEFVKKTKERCPDAIVYHDSAENIKKYLIKHKQKNFDCIISGLPWAVFNKNSQNKLLNAAYDSLEEGGLFLTFAYVQGLILPGAANFKKLIKTKFQEVKKTKIVWKNFPPAFVYYCKK